MIREPHPEELKPFEARTSEQHADWLWNGLFDYLFEDGGRRAFPGAEPFIEQIEGGLASDLGQILLKLSHRGLDRVRMAVTELLAKADFTDPGELDVATILLELGANIKALGLPQIITRKRLTIPSTDPGRRLFATAFDIAAQAGFREPAETAVCLGQLVDTPLFVKPWIGRALVGMTRAAPEQFSQHYDLLRDRLDAVYRFDVTAWRGSPEARAERVSVIRQVARLLGEDRAADLAYPLTNGQTENWWVQSLEDPRLADVRNKVDRTVGEAELIVDPPDNSWTPKDGRPTYATFDQFLESMA